MNKALLNCSCISMSLSSRGVVARAETLEPRVGYRLRDRPTVTVNVCTCMQTVQVYNENVDTYVW